jgi:hypothetical protein
LEEPGKLPQMKNPNSLAVFVNTVVKDERFEVNELKHLTTDSPGFKLKHLLN